MLKIQPLKTQALKMISDARYAHKVKQVKKFFQISENIAPEIRAELEGAKSGIANYAKANKIRVSLSEGEAPNKLNLLLVNLEKKPMIGTVSKPIEYVSPEHTYKNTIIRVSKENGVNKFTLGGKTEDTFLRHIYRNIEVLMKSMKK